MAAAATDKFQYVGNETSTTLAGNFTSGDTTATVGSTSGWPTTTGVTFAIDVVTLVGTEEVQTPGTLTLYHGTVSNGTTLTNVVLATESPNSAQNYAAGSLTRVYMPVSAAQHNRLVGGLLVEHNQDGTHGAVTATSVNVAGTVTSDTIAEKTAAAGVTIDGLLIKDGLVVGGAAEGVNNASLDTTAGAIGGAWTTFTPAATGFSGTPTTNVARYLQVGKTVTMDIDVTGTSNATGFTFTLPVAAKSAAFYVAQIRDNGTSALGLLSLTAASTTATVYRDVIGSAFTASGTKWCRFYGIVYEAN